jgi:flagellar protein FlgJ
MPLEPIVTPHLPAPPADAAQRLRDLAQQAQAGGPDAQERLGEAARMLEAHFVTWLLREMRRTVPEGGLVPRGPATDIYEHLLDDALAKAIARGDGVGLARAIEEQLAPQAVEAPPSAQHHATPSARQATTGE